MSIVKELDRFCNEKPTTLKLKLLCDNKLLSEDSVNIDELIYHSYLGQKC